VVGDEIGGKKRQASSKPKVILTNPRRGQKFCSRKNYFFPEDKVKPCGQREIGKITAHSPRFSRYQKEKAAFGWAVKQSSPS
jgi:hypothetical protein